MRRAVLLAALWAAGCATSSPPRPAAPVDRPPAPLSELLPSDPDLTIGRLDNGLRYYVRENARPAGRAELRLAVNAGSVLEEDDQRGLAHFVEHMAFNGTENFSETQLVSYLESIGMRFGPDLNAYTGFDETVYMLKVPTDDAATLDRALGVLRDWAGRITFAPGPVERERGVIVEEWRLGRGAGARLRDLQMPVLFSGSRYADRLPIGDPSIIRAAPAETLERFYRDWYRPSLMAVVAVGDIDAAAVERRIRELFGDLRDPEDARPRPDLAVPETAATQLSIESDPEATLTTLDLYFRRPPALAATTREDFRQLLAEDLALAALNGRFHEILLGPDPPFLYAGADSDRLVRGAAAFSLSAAARDGDVERALDGLLVEAERLRLHGFTPGELDRARRDQLRGFEQAYREREKLDSAGFAAEYIRNFLVDEPVPGIANEVEMARELIPTITLEEIQQLIGDWIRPTGRVLLVSAPEGEAAELPSREVLAARLDTGASTRPEPWVDRVVDAPLVPDPPLPVAIVEKKRIDGIGVLEWRLANGIRLVLKPTPFRNDQVLLAGFSPGGTSLVNDEEHSSALFAASLLREGGLGEFDAVTLSKALSGEAATASAYIDELEEGVRGSASGEDLETLFQLVYLTLARPRADPQAYESYLTKARGFVANRQMRPEAVFQDRFTEVVSDGHPRRRSLTLELIDEVDPEVAVRIFEERFADLGDAVFVLVGSFVPTEIAPLVATYLGGLPVTGREESWRDPGVVPPTGVRRVEVRRGLEPKARVRLLFVHDAPWSRQGQYDVSALADALARRLRERMREDLGAVYGVNVDGSLSKRPRERATLSVSFGCAPEEVEGLIDVVLAELARAAEEGFPAELLDKVREAQLRERETELETNSFWLDALEYFYTYDLDPRQIQDFESLTATLTPESMAAAARRYVDVGRRVEGVLLPEAAPNDDSVRVEER